MFEKKKKKKENPTTLYVFLMDRFCVSHLSATGTQDVFFFGMENPTPGGNLTLVPSLAVCVNNRTMAFAVGKTRDICTSAESLVWTGLAVTLKGR